MLIEALDHSKFCESCPHQNLNVYAKVVDQYVRVCFQSISVVLSSDNIALASFTSCHLTSSLLNPK